MKIVILAGGGGTRLWPLSRQSRPKQFTKLLNGKTLLENTLERFMGYRPKDIYISTNPQNVPLIKEILPNFFEQNIIIEPEKRDTGPAMGFVAAKLSIEFLDEPIAFIPSDAYIQDPQKLIICLKAAEKLIKDTGKMLDIGIPPEFPSVHLGYTKIAEKFADIADIEVYSFAGHTEKPDLETAKKYLQDGHYLWHGNFYMWTPRLFLEAYKKYVPEIYSHLLAIQETLKVDNTDKVNQEFSQMEKISIDYAITEKMNPKDVLIIKGDFGWSDIGAFDVLYDKLKGESDADGNIIKANHLSLDTKNCFIYDSGWCANPSRTKTDVASGSSSNSKQSPISVNKKIATIGVSDLVIINTPDALLICPKDRSQDVKKIVDKLKESGEEKYL